MYVENEDTEGKKKAVAVTVSKTARPSFFLGGGEEGKRSQNGERILIRKEKVSYLDLVVSVFHFRAIK